MYASLRILVTLLFYNTTFPAAYYINIYANAKKFMRKFIVLLLKRIIHKVNSKKEYKSTTSVGA